jgi:hypothetical protein
MPVLSAAQKVALRKKKQAVGLARNFTRKMPTEDCEEEAKLKAKKAAPEAEAKAETVIDVSKPDGEQSDQ